MIVLAADVGGTNANLAVVETKGYKTLYHERLSTQKTRDFPGLVNEFIKRARLKTRRTPTRGCFAIAGPIQHKGRNRIAKMTNSKLVINEAELQRKTPLTKALLINDFAAIGYSVNVLKGRSFKVLRKGDEVKNATKALVGAGTGLGKGILFYDDLNKCYTPLPSEGGHADFPAQTSDEYRMIQLLRHKTKGPVTNEYVVSGPGIEEIYKYVRRTRYPSAPRLDAEGISKTRHTSSCSREAMKTFAKFYARTCKNFALDTMCQGGLYIVGGIAPKNMDLFGKEFLKEFDTHWLPNFRKLLKTFPIKIITDYHCSIAGAAFAAGKI